MQDLSHIFDNPDLDQAQEAHDAMPSELHDHIWKAIAHNSGHGDHPGKYKGPDATPPEWAPSPEEDYSKNQRDEQNALQNVAAGGPAKIPAPPSPTPGLPLRP